LVSGYRNVSFEKAEAYLKASRRQPRTVEVQFFDADLIATQEHLYLAVLNALAAFSCKTNISKSAAMETMLYASAQRQIQKAIGVLGIKPHTNRAAVMVLGDDWVEVKDTQREISESLGVEPDETVLEMTDAKEKLIRQAFAIGGVELETAAQNGSVEKAIVELVVERMALLSTRL
jgi:tRNA threonylcarbamoyladenosine modification (KEOPS) complex Cgi121 subunit